MPRDPDDADSRASEGSGSVASEGDDSFMRAAAEISEASPSAVGGKRPARADLVAGHVIGKRYHLDRELGRGGMGVVWAATHQVTRRRVAIKFLLGPVNDRDDLRRRFLREARAASAVEHPNVVEVLDVFELEDETPVIVMELLAGETLRSKLEREGKLPLSETSAILRRVLEAVASAHSLGVVHRDLKPDNIFLSQHGTRGEVVKVLDFGIAKLVDGDGHGSEAGPITATGSVVGTPCYMAPEQTMGEKDIDAQADVWALGVILYECLAGVRPLQGSGIGQVVRQLAVEGIRPLDKVVPGLPPELTALVMQMLERERKDRTKDVREAIPLLSRFASRTDTLPSAPGVGARHETPAEEGLRAVPQPPVDTQGAQSVPNGNRNPPRRSMMVGLAAGGIALVALAGWRLSVPPRASGGPPPTAVDDRSLSTGLSTGAPTAPPMPIAVPVAPSAAPPPAAETVPAPHLQASAAPPDPNKEPGRSTHGSPATGHPRPSTSASASASAAAAAAIKPAPDPAPPPPAPAAPSASPRPQPGGLAEKAPF